MSAKPILVVGSMAFDDLQFPRPIADPDQPDRRSTSFDNVVGGSATYASLSASCYAPVRVVAIVGDDFPESMLNDMRSRNIDTQGVERAAGPTFRWAGRYHADLVGRETLDTQLNVFADFQPKLPASYQSTPIVLLGNIHPQLQLDVLASVNEPTLVAADTMNFWIGGEPETLAKVLKRIDLLIINDEEARELSGLHNLALAARDIRARGPQKLIIKQGEHGALYFDDEGIFSAPALLLDEVADPTGAGDCFAGGVLGYLANQARADHAAMRRAMLHGTAVASFCVEALGTAGVRALDQADLDRRVAQIRQLSQVDATVG